VKLYAYWRSSASWRARIALAWKNVSYELIPVNLLEQAQRKDEYRALNPMAQLPTLELDDGRRIAQSLAIIEYLEETIPEPALLPRDPYLRARARQLAEIVNAGIQPLQNLSVFDEVEKLGGRRIPWAQHFVSVGLDALQSTAQPGPFLAGDAVSIADLCLVPQLYNARRFKLDVTRWPQLLRVEENCLRLAAFQGAHPDRQPDAVVEK
jgi:maleylpyruvate isomerase